MDIDSLCMQIYAGPEIFFLTGKGFKKKLLTAESVGGCWLSLYVQLRCISITLQYLKIEIDKSELSAPPPVPPFSLPLQDMRML